jgi:hypothetical protein
VENNLKWFEFNGIKFGVPHLWFYNLCKEIALADIQEGEDLSKRIDEISSNMYIGGVYRDAVNEGVMVIK